ncbi:PREDICTED: pentatricopeptide repeat-containing protein At4g32450, mitochondrial-like [Nicotiana attenuata]|uniref:Pentatricopeptide repeat-containing protein n=1 Tax=Nicotiana attenuata TaxID=49451 RepID=A0A1J6JN28_NICAT|nr:PREDICTED: pentatricopeptide repeat-containing protein At4g32450, mitochondrial-like [Nicotiana attenuata]XP_019224450.1 PREDICTED: pentatricopeptide repeat-containing protein At4g32450, mitochondrial-like [Nicotiana attenuata]XP_019241753.1 PREDICTED: pentatricopeptide repeat-containing protein At4g32450, mitochondrial-like [Nicotiana attenuata]XP_019241754.1 PREDICTED: pentatricopeptide repeat-containing protein At4g32450, mitochondrial-like [Nicotiana attenuata]OIT19197.1 pentatricopeptid
MYRSRATTFTAKSLRTLTKVCRQNHHLESFKFVTFSRNLSTATQISEFDNYREQNPDGVFNYNSNNTNSLNPRQNPRAEFQESANGARGYFSKDTIGFPRDTHGQNENFALRNDFQQTVRPNGSLSSSSNDFGSRKEYQNNNLVQHNRNDADYKGENSSNVMHSSRFEGRVEAQPSQNGVYGHYQQNLNRYYGGNSEASQQNFSANYTRNIGVPQPSYIPGNVRNVQAGNSETYPQSASAYDMERHTNSSGYSREMMGQYQQNVSGFNPSSTGHQASYQSQNGIVGNQEMRSSTPVEQSIDSADSSIKKGSIDELDNFCKEGKVKEAVEVLHLLEQQHVTVNLSRYITLMDVCGEDKSLEEAKSVHEHLVRSHPHLDVKTYNKILEMYGKCGSMNDAFSVFQKMPQRNLTSWDTMITWLAKNGLGEDAIELFAEFKKTGMKPDGQMYLGVFHACSVVGDIVEGMLHFESMSKDYGIVHSMEHYVGVVDMLGSTGYLIEAIEFIEKMPIEPSIEVWETMMNLCRIHGNLELGDRCAEIVELLDPSRLDEQSKAGFLAVKASDIAKDKEKKKSAQSLLEARSRVHEYRAGDRSHPDHEKIYELLRGLKQLMKEDGYIPEIKFVLHDVDQETKEDALMAHSERLAFAQGLMSSSARSPIRIIKNLRVCGDCHNALKIASRLVGREIIMRDAKRFHHLKDGLCSCRDYW